MFTICRLRPNTLAGLTLVSVLLVAGCTKHSTDTTNTAAPPLPPAKVRITTVRIENVPVITEVTGTVRPVQRATISAKVMGAIDELPIALGQRVRAGDLLVKITAGEITARVAQAQAQLNSARRDLERERALLARGASTADTVRGLEDRLAAAEAMIREAEAMLAYTIIKAPFDGVIARKFADAGDLASPGHALLELEDTGRFHVEVALPDSLAAELRNGAPLIVEIPAAGSVFTGAITELSSAADATARTVLAKIAVPADTPVRSGQFVRVQVPGAPVRALLAPGTAVSSLGQMQRVFVATADNRTELRLVKTGAVHRERVEILSGLDNAERIVIAPPAGLREGQPLEIVP